MSKIIILCGKIASGKTTYANKIKANRMAAILSVDDLMLKLFDGCLGEKHKETVERISQYFYGLAEEMTAKGIDVIFDFGYWTKKERMSIRQHFKNKGIITELHYIKTNENERLKRLERRNEILSKSGERAYIIREELRKRLDAEFEEPADEEIDILVEE